LAVPANSSDAPVNVEIGAEVWWLNKDGRGNLWINGREKRDTETAEAATPPSGEAGAKPASTDTLPSEPTALPVEPAAPNLESAPSAAAAQPETAGAVESAAKPTAGEPGNVLGAVRLLLQETRTGSFAGKLERVATDLGKNPEDLESALVGAGLKIPEKPREKPVFVEHGGEIFWFNRNAKGELWVNAKPSKFSGGGDEGGDEDKKPARRGRSRSRKSDTASETSSDAAV
jgi:hypothetical protein